jgi:hypothetical protein
MWGMSNKSIGGRCSDTQSHPTHINNTNKVSVELAYIFVSYITCESDPSDGGGVTVAVPDGERYKPSETRHVVQSCAESYSEASVHPTVNNWVVAGM